VLAFVAAVMWGIGTWFTGFVVMFAPCPVCKRPFFLGKYYRVRLLSNRCQTAEAKSIESIRENVAVQARSSVRICRPLTLGIVLAIAAAVSCSVYDDLKAGRVVREKVQAEFGVAPTVAVRGFKSANASVSTDSVTVRLPPTPGYNREVVTQRVRAIVREAFPRASTINVIEAPN